MYTKAELVEQIFLILNKGQVDPSSANVKHADIRKYLDAAVRSALIINARSRRREDGGDGKQSYREYINAAFVETKDYALVRADVDAVPYIDITETVMVLPDDVGIYDIFPASLKNNTSFVRMRKRTDDIGMEDAWAFITRYWLERGSQGKYRVYLRNISPIVENVTVQLIRSVSDYGDNDILAIPAGMEELIAQQLLNLFNLQNGTGDMNNDNRHRQE